MKSDGLIAAIGGIDDELIESADAKPSAKKKPAWGDIVSLAAAFVLVAALCVPALLMKRQEKTTLSAGVAEEVNSHYALPSHSEPEDGFVYDGEDVLFDAPEPDESGSLSLGGIPVTDGGLSYGGTEGVDQPNGGILPSLERRDLADLFSYADYLQFIKTDTSLPDGFVYYENGPDEIGSFKSLVVMDETHCMYTLTDENGFDLSLYIEDISDDEALRKLYREAATPVSMESLRKVTPETAEKLPPMSDVSAYFTARGWYFNSGSALYLYNSLGECSNIRWCEGNTEYSLYGHGYSDYNSANYGFADYPLHEKETFVFRLLSAGEAEETIASFNDKVSKSGPSWQADTDRLSPWVRFALAYAFLALVSVAAVCVFRKKA